MDKIIKVVGLAFASQWILAVGGCLALVSTGCITKNKQDWQLTWGGHIGASSTASKTSDEESYVKIPAIEEWLKKDEAPPENTGNGGEPTTPDGG